MLKLKNIVNNIKSIDMPTERPLLKKAVSTGHARGEYGVSGSITPFIIKKRWGEERIYQNNKNYCSKLLVINPQQFTSMHFHIDKHETMVVVKGQLYIDYNNNKKMETICLKEYESFVIAPGLPHRLRAGKIEVHLMEASTTSNDNDSIRIS